MTSTLTIDLPVPVIQASEGLSKLLDSGPVVDAIDFLLTIEGPLAVPGQKVDSRAFSTLLECIDWLCGRFQLDMWSAQEKLGYTPTRREAWMLNLQALALAEANQRFDNYAFDLPLIGAADWTTEHRRLFLQAVHLQRVLLTHKEAGTTSGLEVDLIWGQVYAISLRLKRAYFGVRATPTLELTFDRELSTDSAWGAAIRWVAQDKRFGWAVK